MIALCLKHAKHADQGKRTSEQLRKLKANPFLKGNQISGELNWLRQNILYIAGSNFVWNVDTVLSISGRKVIWVNKDETGNMLLNMDLTDPSGGKFLVMENNDWLVYEPEDVKCKPGGHYLKAISKDKTVNFEIQYKNVTCEEFVQLWMGEMTRSFEFSYKRLRQRFPGLAVPNPKVKANNFLNDIIKYMGEPKTFTQATLNGYIVGADRRLSLGPKKLVAEDSGTTLSFNFMSGKTALSF